MPLTFSGYRLTDTDATGANANSIYASSFTIDGTATEHDLVISDGSDVNALFGDGGGDSHIDPTQTVVSSTDNSFNTGNSINYEAVIRFSGSDGNTYTAVIFDYDEDGAAGVDNNNSDGLNNNGLYEEGFFIGFIRNDFDPNNLPANISPGPVPPPGTTLTKTADLINNAQFNVFVCFAKGTQIEMSDGTKAVEDLCEGDLVMTADHGPKQVKWIGSRLLSNERLIQNPELRPVRISAGALGAGLPVNDLIVSPQHRVLVRSEIANKMFGQQEVLVAAKQLLQLSGIDIADDLEEVTYFHFLFDQHEVVFANGAEAESLYTGAEALKSVGAAARKEIFAIFPNLIDLNYAPSPARLLINGRRGRTMAIRHKKNARPLVSDECRGIPA